MADVRIDPPTEQQLAARLAQRGKRIVFESIQAFRRSGAVDEVSGGLHFPEKPSLGFFKERLGFTLARVPSRVLLWSPAATYLRRTRPNQCYRQ